MNSPDEFEEKAHRFLDGRATPEEVASLSRQIEVDAVARTRYLELSELHACLMANETLRPGFSPKQPEPPQLQHSNTPRLQRVPAWRLLVGGALFGVFLASTIWAYALPRSSQFRELPLVDGGFERESPREMNGVPVATGYWSGDLSAVPEQDGAVLPHSGARMLRFLAAGKVPDQQGNKNMASDLWQVLTLPGTGTRTVKVRAWFNASSKRQARFHLMAMACGEDAQAAPQIWEQRYVESTLVPAAARAMIFVDSDPKTWELGEVTLTVPAQARTLIVSIAAYRFPFTPASHWFEGQFVDEVTVMMQQDEPSIH
jgi:hypothetical protein